MPRFLDVFDKNTLKFDWDAKSHFKFLVFSTSFIFQQTDMFQHPHLCFKKQKWITMSPIFIVIHWPHSKACYSLQNTLKIEVYWLQHISIFIQILFAIYKQKTLLLIFVSLVRVATRVQPEGRNLKKSEFNYKLWFF